MRLKVRRVRPAHVRQQRHVAAHRDEVGAVVQHPPDVVVVGAQEPGRLARLVDPREGVLDRGAHLGVPRVADVPQRRREVAGPHEERVDAVHRGDRLDVRQRLRRLHLTGRGGGGRRGGEARRREEEGGGM